MVIRKKKVATVDVNSLAPRVTIEQGRKLCHNIGSHLIWRPKLGDRPPEECVAVIDSGVPAD
jgi:hypothetical protein